MLQGSSVYIPQPAFAGFKLLKFPFDFKNSGEWSTQFLPAKYILTYMKSFFFAFQTKCFQAHGIFSCSGMLTHSVLSLGKLHTHPC